MAVNSEVLMRAPLALLPVLLFLAGLVQRDSYKLVRLRTVLALVVAGALAAGASYLVSNARSRISRAILPPIRVSYRPGSRKP